MSSREREREIEWVRERNTHTHARMSSREKRDSWKWKTAASASALPPRPALAPPHLTPNPPPPLHRSLSLSLSLLYIWYICIHLSIYLFINMCIRIHNIYICTYMYTCTYMHIYTDIYMYTTYVLVAWHTMGRLSVTRWDEYLVPSWAESHSTKIAATSRGVIYTCGDATWRGEVCSETSSDASGGMSADSCRITPQENVRLWGPAPRDCLANAVNSMNCENGATCTLCINTHQQGWRQSSGVCDRVRPCRGRVRATGIVPWAEQEPWAATTSPTLRPQGEGGCARVKAPVARWRHRRHNWMWREGRPQPPTPHTSCHRPSSSIICREARQVLWFTLLYW